MEMHVLCTFSRLGSYFSLFFGKTGTYFYALLFIYLFKYNETYPFMFF